MFKFVWLASLVSSVFAYTVNIPTTYTASIVLNMPYYGLNEPIKVVTDAVNGLQYTSYYEDSDIYVLSTSGFSYEIVPTAADGVNSVETCFVSGSSDLVSFFPDITYFVTDTTTVYVVNDAQVYASSYATPEYNETTGFDGTYILYSDINTGLPVQMHMIGFNVIQGSHYDEYIYNYISISSDIDSSVFDVAESYSCSALPSDDDSSSTASGPTIDTLKDLFLSSPHNHEQRIQEFESFLQKYGKSYPNKLDYAQKMAMFFNTMRFIYSMNRKHLSYTMGINHLADLTSEERKELLGRLKTTENDFNSASSYHQVKGNHLPRNFDWREKGAVTSVKDQGTCGSCWAFGTAGVLEGQNYIVNGIFQDLSEQNLMDCSWEFDNYGCGGGLDYQAYDWIMEHGGIATLASYGVYTNQDGSCHFTGDDVIVGASIKSYVNVTSDDADAFNDALVNIGPLSVAINAAPNSFYFYESGLYDDTSCSGALSDLDHAVLAVGYETVLGKMYTIIKNSWSIHWGEEGYARVAQDGNICGILTFPTYPIIA